MGDVSILVELKLSDTEIGGKTPVEQGQWKAYPHGWTAPDDNSLSPRVKAAVVEDMADMLVEECYTFVRNQYDHGSPPQAWRIKKGSHMIAHGTDRPGETT